MSKKIETPLIVRWRYHYLWRGIWWVFLIGMLTWLYFFFRAGARR